MPLTQANDPFGAAVKSYFTSHFNFRKKIKVHSSISGEETISVSYLFRKWKSMPAIERRAIELCKGRILDVGACAGSHSLILQNQNKDVTALEISPLCCEVMESRGVSKVICADIYLYTKDKYDTILLLMNGVGLAGNLEGLKKLLQHLKSILLPGGQIIFDSSDIDYAYYQDDGSKWLDLNNDYYGQVQYSMEYKNVHGEKFNWLFIDAETMADIAKSEGFKFKILAEGDHYDYLGILEPK